MAILAVFTEIGITSAGKSQGKKSNFGLSTSRFFLVLDIVPGRYQDCLRAISCP